MNLRDSLRYFGSYVVGDIVQDTIKTYKDPISSAIGSIPVIGGYASKAFEESFLTSESDAIAQALGFGTKKSSLSFDGNNGQVNAALNNAKVQDFLMSASRVKIPAATIKATNTIKLPTGIPKVATKKKGLG